MSRENITSQQAFDLLVQASQRSNIKLTEVATWLIHEHDLRRKPTGPATPNPQTPCGATRGQQNVNNPCF